MRRTFRRRSFGGRRSRSKLARKVKKIMARNLEDKCTSYTSSLVSYNSGMNSQGDVLPLIKMPGEGTSSEARIGKQIRAKACVVRGSMYVNGVPYQTSTFPVGAGGITAVTSMSPYSRIGVRIIIGFPKRYPDASAAYDNWSSWVNTLLDDGSATTQFDGTLKTWMLPVNKDAFTVYKDYKKVLYATQITAQDSTVDNQVTTPVNMKTSTKTFKFKIPCARKLIKFVNDSTELTSWNPVILVGYCFLDNASPDTTTTSLRMMYHTHFYYEDA